MSKEELPERVPGEPENMGTPEKKEIEMVEAVRIRTVFTDQKALEKIADELHSKGFVSGFSIEPIEAGYFHHGRRVKERQYALDLLIDPSETEERRQTIIQVINSEIGKRWETPDITEEKVQINKDLLGFIKRAETEHGRYKKERRMRLSLTLALLMSISGLIGAVSKRYVERREEKAVAAEREKEFERLNKIDQKIQLQISNIELKLQMGQQLEKKPGVEFGGDYYPEIHQIEKTVEEGVDEIMKLMELEKGKERDNR
ncbi:MAG: hypothetical protein ABSE18_00145 [Minisyncoccia bacterium]|jgi:hypothetical protein